MQGLRWLQMSDEELGAFLGRGGTGVISFATEGDDPPVSIPLSYGYNGDEGAFYYRLSVPEGSTKADLVDADVSFVTHRETDDGWRSVVATGRLEAVSSDGAETDALQGMWPIEIPIVDIFERSHRETAFRYVRLVPETMSGRKEVQSDASGG